MRLLLALAAWIALLLATTAVALVVLLVGEAVGAGVVLSGYRKLVRYE